MISKITIGKIATYKDDVEVNPAKINFIFGANGTGKSTLSRVLKRIGENNFASCNIEWENNNEEEILVYNKEFIEENFLRDERIKGIFTLGEKAVKVRKEIDNNQKLLEDKNEKLERYEKSIDEINTKLQQLEAQVIEECWEKQKEVRDSFPLALQGYRNSKLKFFYKVKEVYDCLASDTFSQAKFNEIEKLYQLSFSDDLEKDEVYKTNAWLGIDEGKIITLLKERIIGKNDSSIGQLIDFLNNSDWVKHGIQYMEHSDGKCPFCQQPLHTDVKSEIEEYFDQEYNNKYEKLIKYKGVYAELKLNIENHYKQIINSIYSYISEDKIKDFKEKYLELIKIISENLNKIENKCNNLSMQYTVESIENYIVNFNETISTLNEEVKNHNSIVDDKAKSQNLCKKQLWEYITENLKDMLDTYTKKTSDNNKALKSIREKRAAIKSEIIELKKEISDKQKDLTSIHPVAENINNVLNKFGFTGFRISIDNEKKGAYKIVRPTGEDASKSLSEGEHNFISFLYYYYLCLGSQNEEYPQRKRVLVIDDPVSSMDSNVLFIVSTLVRDLIRKCKEEGKKTEQIIILTHNVYFYKEITYLGRGSDSNYKYFILRKCSETTSIEEYSSNPINTAYEALWKELENKDEHSTVIIMNVMRRILEYYFTVIGGIQYEKCIDEMEGTDKYICKSLISFINEGSHAIFEDILYQSDEQNIDNYKRVFKEIFNILGHSAHYDMMMKKVK